VLTIQQWLNDMLLQHRHQRISALHHTHPGGLPQEGFVRHILGQQQTQ
jgi:hypothetical protein